MNSSPANSDDQSASQLMAAVLKLESDQIAAAGERLLTNTACQLALEKLVQCKGRILFTGMGKMGFVARKAAATFCSTGAPAIYLHPTEAIHGDLGIVTADDVLIALSNSGETNEVLKIVEYAQRVDVPVIALTGDLSSALAVHSDVVLDCCVQREADEFSLAPTCSTTVTLAMADALGIALMKARGFTAQQFAIFHPGGMLGKKLLLKVDELMRCGDEIPVATAGVSFGDALRLISEKKMGCVLLTDGGRRLIGIITDGDLRRHLAGASGSVSEMMVGGVETLVSSSPATIEKDRLAAEAMRLMEDRQITTLPVVDADGGICGLLHLHDLIKAGLA
jgi:arabinose-5-phosphate isomerase